MPILGVLNANMRGYCLRWIHHVLTVSVEGNVNVGGKDETARDRQTGQARERSKQGNECRQTPHPTSL